MFSSLQRASVAGVAVFVVAWIGNPFPPSASGTELAVSLPVPQVGISADKAGRAVFHCPQAQRFSQTGRPNLPWQVVTVLLPPGADPGSVRARLEGVAVAPIAGHWNVTPAPFEFTWRDGQPQVAMPAVGTLVDGRDVDVYARTEPWPALADLHVESGAMREWKLTQVVVPLFQYAPASGTLQRISGGRLVFTFDNGTAPAPGALATATASPRADIRSPNWRSTPRTCSRHTADHHLPAPWPPASPGRGWPSSRPRRFRLRRPGSRTS